MSEFEKYSSEAKAKWGETEAFEEYAEKTKGYSENKWENIAEGLNGIFAQFAKCMQNGEKPKSDKAQSLVKALQEHITENFYNCTKEILSGLGQMYVLDERFKKNIDLNGAGTADFVCSAIEAYLG
ncbi:MAG: TipAS antibiotic-recognition domain-containing protein [Oscillospiraceae bacterium]|nr:TipAS antibiotic-recognition domain-containing protein [Oscillospiraceae bacterium]